MAPCSAEMPGKWKTSLLAEFTPASRGRHNWLTFNAGFKSSGWLTSANLLTQRHSSQSWVFFFSGLTSVMPRIFWIFGRFLNLKATGRLALHRDFTPDPWGTWVLANTGGDVEQSDLRSTLSENTLSTARVKENSLSWHFLTELKPPGTFLNPDCFLHLLFSPDLKQIEPWTQHKKFLQTFFSFHLFL